MFKASLERKVATANKDIGKAKKGRSEAQQTSGQSKGSLTTVKAELSEDRKSLGALHHSCLSKATDFQVETKSRGEEMKALAEAIES
jgi:hypothetical protein